MWPFRRARRESPKPAPAPAAPVYRAGPGDWRHLPAMPTVQASRPAMSTFDVQFAQRLATRADPTFLGQLGHYVVADAPSGSVKATAVPTHQEFAPRPRLDPPTIAYEAPPEPGPAAAIATAVEAAGPAAHATSVTPSRPAPTVSRRLLQAPAVELPRYPVDPAPEPLVTLDQAAPSASTERGAEQATEVTSAAPPEEAPLLPGHVELPTAVADWALEGSATAPTADDTHGAITPPRRAADAPATVSRSLLPGAGPRPIAPPGSPTAHRAGPDRATAAATQGTAAPRPRIGAPLDTPQLPRRVEPAGSAGAAPTPAHPPPAQRIADGRARPPAVGTLGTSGPAPLGTRRGAEGDAGPQPVPTPIDAEAAPSLPRATTTSSAAAPPTPMTATPSSALPLQRTANDPTRATTPGVAHPSTPAAPIGAPSTMRGEAPAPATRPILGDAEPVAQLRPDSADPGSAEPSSPEVATTATGATGAAAPSPSTSASPPAAVATVARTPADPAGPTASLLGARPTPRVITLGHHDAPGLDDAPVVRPATAEPATLPHAVAPGTTGTPGLPAAVAAVAQRTPLHPGAPTAAPTPAATPARAHAGPAWSTVTFSATAPGPISFAVPDDAAVSVQRASAAPVAMPLSVKRAVGAGPTPEPTGTITTPTTSQESSAATSTPAPAAPETRQRSDAEIQELLTALYPPLRRRLGRDLLLDRERHGYRTDIRF